MSYTRYKRSLKQFHSDNLDDIDTKFEKWCEKHPNAHIYSMFRCSKIDPNEDHLIIQYKED